MTDLTAQYLKEQVASKAVLTEVAWLRLLPAVCRAFAEGGKVSIAQILPRLMERPGNFFQDVVDAAQLLLSPRVLSFRDRSDLEKKVLEVLDAVKDHAASLMAQVALSGGAECSSHWLKSEFGTEWDQALDRVVKLLPCLAVHEDRDLMPPYNVCGLPSIAHDCHKPRIRRHGWFVMLWGGGPRGGGMWEGAHELGELVPLRKDLVATSVFDRAVQIMKLFMNGQALSHRTNAREQARRWVKSNFKAVAHSRLLSSCYICGEPFAEAANLDYLGFLDILVGGFRKSLWPSLEICYKCGEVCCPPIAAL